MLHRPFRKGLRRLLYFATTLIAGLGGFGPGLQVKMKGAGPGGDFPRFLPGATAPFSIFLRLLNCLLYLIQSGGDLVEQ